jgi:hypothetical protein
MPLAVFRVTEMPVFVRMVVVVLVMVVVMVFMWRAGERPRPGAHGGRVDRGERVL